MNKHVLAFIDEHKDKLQGRVIEIGSYNVNGSVREIIDVTVGVDMRRGPGVDLVCAVSDLADKFPQGSFDACVSTDTLEHVQDWKSFVNTSWGLVKEGGWLVITMASLAKGKHDYPNDFWRMDEQMIKTIWPNAQYANCGKTSIGWVVKKEGSLGFLDEVTPIEI